MNPLVTRLVSAGAAAGAAVVARRAVEAGWQATRGTPPPKADEVTDDRDLRDLLVWSALAAGAVVIAQRLAGDRARALLRD